jgi:hypothetical protein
MKARTSALIIFIAAVFVFATLSHGYHAQTTSEQERTAQQTQSGNTPDVSGSETGQQTMTNEAGTQGETPGARPGSPMQPVVIRHVGWSWLLITGLIGFVLGRLTSSRRRPYGREEDIRRNRAA